MKIEAGDYCPLIKKDCVGLKCSWFTHIRGSNPNTGEDVDEWSCAIKWVPLLLIENSQQQRQTGAAVESFRNETIKANQENQEIYQEILNQQKIIPINVALLNNTVEEDQHILEAGEEES